MNKRAYEYFINIDEKNLPTKNGVFVADSKRMPKLKSHKIVGNSDIQAHLLDEHVFLLKPAQRETYINSNNINALANSEMYIDLGFITPPTRPIMTPRSRLPFIMSQDVRELAPLHTILAEYANLYPNRTTINSNDNKWQILYDQYLQDKFLKVMTPECFDELISLFLLGELRTDGDTHKGNYFLYKNDVKGKFEGIIPIDLEESIAIIEEARSKSEFKTFAKSFSYSTYTPVESTDISTPYSKRVEQIKKLIQDGVLSQNQIELLKNMLSYNLPQKIKDIYNRYNFIKGEFHDAYDPTACLWEYNRQAFKDELEL